MKRALRSFGDRFGNGLYGDQAPAIASARAARAPAQSQANRRDNSQAEKLRERLIEIVVEQGFDEDGLRNAVVNRKGKSIDDLTADELEPLVEAAAAKLNRMRQAA